MTDEILRMRATVVSDEAITSLRNLGKELGLTGKNVNLKSTRLQFETLSGTVRRFARDVKEVAAPALSSFGFVAGGVAASGYGLVRMMRDVSDRIANLKNSSSELGISIRHIQAFQTAADKAGIAPEAAMAGLQTFKRNAEDFTLRIGELRDRLKDLGAGDVVERIAAAATPLDGLRIAFERMQALERSNPVLARRFAEDMFGNAELARLGWAGFLAEYSRTEPITQKQITDAKAVRNAMIDIGKAFDDLKLKFATGMMPQLKSELRDVEAIVGLFKWIDDHLVGLGGDGGDALGRATGSLLPSHKKPEDAYRDRLEKLDPKGGAPQLNWWENFKRNIAPPAPNLSPRSGYRPSSFGDLGSDKDATKQGTKEGVVEGLIEYATLVQGGAGGFMNAAFNPGGGEGGQRGSVGGGFRSGGGYTLGTASKALAGGGRRALAKSLGMDRGSIADASAAISSEGVDRSRFAKELAGNPSLKEKLFHIAAGEDSPGSASGTLANQAIMESAMNRAEMTGSSLAQAARHTREGGYYAGWSNFNEGQRAIMESNLAKVLAGSNVAQNATDNSSSWLAAKEKRSGAFKWVKDINGESFFTPGWRNAGGGRDRPHFDAMMARRSAAAGRMDQQIGGGGNTTATGTVNVNVHAPRGTKVAADSDGLWQETTVRNYRQMQPTESPGW